MEPEPSEAERGAIEAALAEAQADQDPRGGADRGAWWRRGVEENAGEPSFRR